MKHIYAGILLGGINYVAVYALLGVLALKGLGKLAALSDLQRGSGRRERGPRDADLPRTIVATEDGGLGGRSRCRGAAESIIYFSAAPTFRTMLKSNTCSGSTGCLGFTRTEASAIICR